MSNSRQIVTIFGASGFIGRHLVRRLTKDGWVVRAVCRDPEDAHFLRPMGDVGQVIPWAGDITNDQSVGIALDGASAVVNLVGILFESGKATFENIHTGGARRVAEAAAARGITQFVHMSALGASEDSPAQYARTKGAGEAAVLQAVPTARIIRPSVVFGPEDNFFNQFAAMSRLSPALPVMGALTIPRVSLGGTVGINIDFLGDGGPKFQPVYVADVAKAMAACLTEPATEGQTYELAGPTIYSFADLMRLVLKVTHRRRLLMPIPFWLAQIQGFFMEFLPKPLITRDQVALMQSDNVQSGALPTLEDLGIQATPAEAILPSYLHRYRAPVDQKPLTEDH